MPRSRADRSTLASTGKFFSNITQRPGMRPVHLQRPPYFELINAKLDNFLHKHRLFNIQPLQPVFGNFHRNDFTHCIHSFHQFTLTHAIIPPARGYSNVKRTRRGGGLAFIVNQQEPVFSEKTGSFLLLRRGNWLSRQIRACCHGRCGRAAPKRVMITPPMPRMVTRKGASQPTQAISPMAFTTRASRKVPRPAASDGCHC